MFFVDFEKDDDIIIANTVVWRKTDMILRVVEDANPYELRRKI